MSAARVKPGDVVDIITAPIYPTNFAGHRGIVTRDSPGGYIVRVPGWGRLYFNHQNVRPLDRAPLRPRYVEPIDDGATEEGYADR